MYSVINRIVPICKVSKWQVFHSKMYKRVKRRNSYTVRYIENGHEMFVIVHSYRTIKVQNCNHTEEYQIAVMEPVVVLHDKLCVADHIKVVQIAKEYIS